MSGPRKYCALESERKTDGLKWAVYKQVGTDEISMWGFLLGDFASERDAQEIADLFEKEVSEALALAVDGGTL